jgi:hypothetical protein
MYIGRVLPVSPTFQPPKPKTMNATRHPPLLKNKNININSSNLHLTTINHPEINSLKTFHLPLDPTTPDATLQTLSGLLQKLLDGASLVSSFVF